MNITWNYLLNIRGTRPFLVHFKNFNVLLSSNTSGSLPNNQPTRPRSAAPYLPPFSPLFPHHLPLNCWPAQRAGQPAHTRRRWSGANNHSSNHIVIIINNFALSLPNNGNGIDIGCANDGTTSCVAWPGSCLALANRLIILSRVGQTPNTKTRPGGPSCAAPPASSSSRSKVRQARMGCHEEGRVLGC